MKNTDELVRNFAELNRILDEIGNMYSGSVLESFETARSELRDGVSETMNKILTQPQDRNGQITDDDYII